MQARHSQPAPGEAATVSPAEAAKGDSARGLFFALSAYGLWGFLPLYMKAVAHIPAHEVLAHRILWSVPVAGILLLILRRTADITAALKSPRTLAMAVLTAAIISTNWGTYVWAIAADRTVETALGYYINPLVTVALGALLLGEKLTRLQLVAVALAVVAVAILTVATGGLPWVSLFLAFTFAAYGYLRKTLPIGPSQGFFLEVVILLPFALGWAIWLAAIGQGHFSPSNPDDFWLLMFAGPATAVPLILYAFGAKLLRITTIGITQYTAPTMIAAIGVFVFGEPFGTERIVAFALIWTALALYTWSMFRSQKTTEN
ncbi:MAG: EamA family transporter RarD [Rhizobiaceae bacterium]|nr:EamA family transporter RarD [Rhizobiaceae bacterium]